MRHEIYLVTMNTEFLYVQAREIYRRGTKKQLVSFLNSVFLGYTMPEIRGQADEIWESFETDGGY